jgi:flagellar hook-associated protein 2
MATSIIGSLGAGSGIDIRQLSTDLVAAEQAPLKAVIEGRIARQENRITGYNALLGGVAELRAALAGLDDRNDFAGGMGSTLSSQPERLAITASSGARNGVHSVQVTQLAQAQRSMSAGGWSAPDTPLHGGQPFEISVTVGGTAHRVAVATDTPAGVVTALQNAGLGLNARLIDTGASPVGGDLTQRFRLSVDGAVGAAQAFSLAVVPPVATALDPLPAAPLLGFLEPPADGSAGPAPAGVRAAQDAQLTVDGVMLSRPSNQVSDAIDGVSFDLRALTDGPATVSVQPDNGVIKSRFSRVVTAYNGLQDLIRRASVPGDDGVALNGVLVGDPSIRLLRDSVRQLFTQASDSPAGDLKSLWQMGLSVDRSGVMSLDDARLDSLLAERLGDVGRAMTALRAPGEGDTGQGLGLAGMAVATLDRLSRSDGFLKSQTRNAQTAIDGQQKSLLALEDRMARLKARYLKQFSAMEAILGASSGVKSSLSGLSASE